MPPSVTDNIIEALHAVDNKKQNIVDAIDAIDRREIPFLNILGWGLEAGPSKGVNSLSFPCFQVEHTWQNDELIPSITSLLDAYAAAAGSFRLQSGEAAYLISGETLAATSGNNTTIFQVDAVDTATDTVTVTVLRGDAAHVAGTKLYSMGRPAPEGQPYATSGKVTAITSDTNHTQIFGGGRDGVVAVTGRRQAVMSYGIQNYLGYQESKRFTELVIRLEQSAMYQQRTATVPAAESAEATRMGGLHYFIVDQTGGIVKDANGLDIGTNEGILKDALDEIWGAGGSANLALMNTFQRRRFSDMLVPFVRTDRTERVNGVVVNEYEYSHGSIRVALSKWVHDSHIWLLNPEYIGIGPLQGNGVDRSFHVEEMPKTGDYEVRVISGEYVMEVRNRKRSHALIRNLPTS